MAAVVCKSLGALCDCAKPLCGFVLATVATQIPLAISAAMGLSGLLDGCKGAQWLLGMFIAAIAHVLASVYAARRVANRTDAALRTRNSSLARISYLMCHDPWIALYLLIVAFFVAWLITGSVWALNDSMASSPACARDLGDRVSLALGLGWAHFCAAPSVLACALCCACCDRTDYAADAAEFAAKEAAEEAKRRKKEAEAEERRRRRRQGAATDGDDRAGDVESPAISPVPVVAVAEDPSAKRPTAPPANYSADGVPVAVAEPLPPPVPPPRAARSGAGDAGPTAPLLGTSPSAKSRE